MSALDLPEPQHKYAVPKSRWDVEAEGAVVAKADAPKSDFWKVVPKGPDASRLAHPDRDTVAESAKDTMDVLSKIVNNKITAANPKALNANVQPGGPQYIKYTAKQASKHHNSGVDHRIIQMQEMPVDPLEPPKWRMQKAPRVPDQTPVPVMHSPPRPVTKEDQANWKIPPCVSAWKNNKGYTIPLDKRLAADGRGMQEVTLNKKHMDLAQSLYAAEELARKETELQAKVQAEIKQRQKQKKEAQLRELAAQARMGGAAGAPAGASLASRLDDAADAGRGDNDAGLPPPPARSSDLPPPPPRGSRYSSREDGGDEGGGYGGRGGRSGRDDMSREDLEEKRKRDELRQERMREREREYRLAEKNRVGANRSKLTRDRERDVSEQIALNQANISGNKEVQYDSRLFNRDSGVSHGFTSDDAHNVYDKALFADRSGLAMYWARDTLDTEVYGGGGGAGDERASRTFRPDKGFAGTDAGGTGARSGPVQFEKGETVDDPFGINDVLRARDKR